MTDLQFSANSITATKEITHSGRRYLVSPVIALRAGVLNGVLVEAAEFGKYAQSWSGRPVPLGHPQLNGQYISANSPDVWASDVPGHFWNVEVDGDKLKGEIWIDLAKCESMGERATAIVNRLRAGTPVEVSTGYFSDTDLASGVWNGKPYLGIARNIRPDHLALLPDENGACSWADGCGTPRVNVQEGPMVEETGLFERFLSWLGQHKASEIISNESAPPCAEEEKVEGNMGKEQLIAGLVANSKCKFSQEKLQTWAESDLQVLQESLGDAEQAEAAPAAPEPEVPHRISRPETVPALPPELTSWMAGIESMIKGLTANSEREKAEIVAAIVANSSGAWSEADLMRYDTPKLQGIHASYLPRDYSGNGGYMRMGPMGSPTRRKKNCKSTGISSSRRRRTNHGKRNTSHDCSALEQSRQRYAAPDGSARAGRRHHQAGPATRLGHDQHRQAARHRRRQPRGQQGRS